MLSPLLQLQYVHVAMPRLLALRMLNCSSAFDGVRYMNMWHCDDRLLSWKRNAFISSVDVVHRS